MKAVILAAGQGVRLRPLTLGVPKPLLQVGDRRLIDYHLENLSAAGVHDVFINIHHLARQIENHVGDGATWGLDVSWSREHTLLDTGGAIYRLLPLLGTEPFLAISADIWTDLPLHRLVAAGLHADLDMLLPLAPNPDFHPDGDYGFATSDARSGMLDPRAAVKYNYAGVALMRPSLFADLELKGVPRAGPDPIFPLRQIMDLAIARRRCAGFLWRGTWFNIGTSRELRRLEHRLAEIG